MYTFEFLYEDNTHIKISDIKAMRIADRNSRFRNITGEELLMHQYSLDDDIFLISQKGTSIISNNNLRSITVTNQT